jgi:hypothetical protein
MVRVCAQSFGVSAFLPPSLTPARRLLALSHASVTDLRHVALVVPRNVCSLFLCRYRESCVRAGGRVSALRRWCPARTDREQEKNITKAHTRAHAHTFKRCTSSSRLIMPLERPTARRSRMQQITSTHTPRQLHVRIIAVKYISESARRGDARLARGSRPTTALPRGRTTARSPRPPQTWALHRPSISVRATLRLEKEAF